MVRGIALVCTAVNFCGETVAYATVSPNTGHKYGFVCFSCCRKFDDEKEKKKEEKKEEKKERYIKKKKKKEKKVCAVFPQLKLLKLKLTGIEIPFIVLTFKIGSSFGHTDILSVSVVFRLIAIAFPL